MYTKTYQTDKILKNFVKDSLNSMLI